MRPQVPSPCAHKADEASGTVPRQVPREEELGGSFPKSTMDVPMGPTFH